MMLDRFYLIEKRVCAFLHKRSLPYLRCVFAIIYIWYGAQKLFDLSPINDLVIKTTSWMGIPSFVYILGSWEILIGFCLAFKKFNRIGLLLLFMHFPGTFLPLFTNPEDCFSLFPFGLTLEGQYIFKNLISIGAALVLLGDLHSRKNSATH